MGETEKKATDPISQRPQPLAEGVGPAYHRRYRVELPVDLESARRAMAKLKGDLNSFTPQWLARFEKKEGQGGPLKVGDCFQIHLTGPWNGPVKVIEAGPDSFRLATLEGHLEAGEIFFSVEPVKGGEAAAFTVESLARSRDHLVDFVYDKLPIARFIQTEMWANFCEAFAAEAARGLQNVPPVQVSSEKTDEHGNWVAV